jgi:hypothetical protein
MVLISFPVRSNHANWLLRLVLARKAGRHWPKTEKSARPLPGLKSTCSMTGVASPVHLQRVQVERLLHQTIASL